MPPAPTDDMKPCTLVSAWMIAATCFWCITMSSNDVPCAVSVVANVEPESTLGMKPFGMIMKRPTVPARIRTEKTIVVFW